MQARKTGKKEEPKPMRQKTFLLSLPEETHHSLKIRAAEEKKTIASLINAAIEMFLKGGKKD
jgi:predicted HicB family RNase H-like nuclease